MTATVALAHDVAGDGEPLIILHGLFGSATNWRSITRALAERFRVYTLDLRNHGRAGHAPQMSYPAMAEDVRHFMDSQALSSAHLLGHSMGGKTAMQIALETPARITRLVVVDIAPTPSGRNYTPILNAMRGLDMHTVTRRLDADAALARDIPEPNLRAFLLQNLRRGETGFGWRLGLDGIAASIPELLGFDPPDARFDKPTLFLLGGASAYVSAADEPVIRRYFTGARIQLIEGAGHWLHAERPKAFLEHVQAFLDGTDPQC